MKAAEWFMVGGAAALFAGGNGLLHDEAIA